MPPRLPAAFTSMTTSKTPDRVPHHVAIVMDGNGRWATRRFMPRVAGHKKGMDALRACVRHCGERGVKVLTVFAFSSENWNRPAEEVSGLMDLLAVALAREVAQLNLEGVRIHFVGDRRQSAPRVQHLLQLWRALGHRPGGGAADGARRSHHRAKPGRRHGPGA